MFSEKLIIKNFGPFTEQVEFEFNKVSVIIGPQASGKSIVAKLITIFRKKVPAFNFKESLKEFNISIFSTPDTEITYYSDFYNAKYSNENLDFFPRITMDEDDEVTKFRQTISSLDERIKRIKIELPSSIDKSEIEKAKNNANEINELKTKVIELNNDIIDKYYNGVSKKSDVHYFVDSFYIPSERLFYSMFRDSISSIIKANVPLPSILIDFGSVIENLKNNSQSKSLEFQDIIFESTSDDLTVLKGGNRIRVSFASSGVQSLYPILLICASLVDKQIDAEGPLEYISITIEEPELNLYPQAQNEIIKRIIEAVNTNDKIRLTITTHSPYVLTTINNLLFKSKIEKLTQSKEDGKQTVSSIDFNDKINFEDISAYYIEGGKVENLVDTQTQLINAKKLDSISYTINNEFSELMALYRKLNG